MPVLRRYRLLILFAICAFWTGLILLGRQLPDAPFISAPWRSEQSFEDLLRHEGRKTTTRPNFVLLGVYQSTYESPPLLPGEYEVDRPVPLMTIRAFSC